jgi:hypothetical protein
MIKQETSIFMAENVLKATVVSLDSVKEYFDMNVIDKVEDYWDFEFVEGCNFHLCNRENLEKFIYSPEGLVSIIKALSVKRKLELIAQGHMFKLFMSFDYQAFYNAIMEVWG